MNLPPEDIASLPPEIRLELRRRTSELMSQLGIQTMVAPDGSRVFDLAQLAPALGMTVHEALVIANEAGMTGFTELSRDDLEPLQ